jgi:hypothetical protein
MLIASSFLFLSALQHSQFFHLAAGLTSGVGVLYKNIARDCAKDPGYRLSPIQDCPLFYQHSADAFVKRNLPAKSLALQLEVAAVKEDGRTSEL